MQPLPDRNGAPEESKREENDQGDHDAEVHRAMGVGAVEVPTETSANELAEIEFAEAAFITNALQLGGLNFIEEEDEMELNVADEVPEYIDIDVAVDSGAGDHVLAKVDAPGHTVTESPGSKRGQKFKGAGGHVMDNEGQILLEMLAPLEDGNFNEVDVTWQVTDVCRPLLSVSKVCDKGQHTVTFDAKRAIVRDSRGRIVCLFHRQGNLYIGRMKIKNPAHPSFGGQGK